MADARELALLERVVADAGFRDEFRRDPQAACARLGAPELGAEIADRGKALHTLDERESRSSLAGALAAMAAEAIGVVDLVSHARAEPDSETGRAMSVVLTRLDLRALEAPASREADEGAAVGGDEGAGRRVDEGTGRRGDEGAGRRVDVGVGRRVDEGAVPRGDEGLAEAPVGGASAASLLEHPRFDAWGAARADLEAGTVDPRIVAVLHRLVERHDVGVSVFSSGHSQFVAGSSSVSNHFVGRAVDIASIDGQAVSPGNTAALRAVEEVGRLSATLLPSEIGNPWKDGPAPFFSDAAHQDHIHLGFDDPPDPGVVARLAEAETEAEAPAPEPEAGGSAVFAALRERPPAAPNTLARLAAVAQEEPVAAREPAVLLEPRNYPGDGAGREAIAAWMAARAEAAGLPGELPVMAALVESGLENLDGGDRDSVGFFQMRTSIWDRGEYAGYADDPELQLRWFIDHAVALQEERGSRDPAEWGEWIADVERPAFEYRGRYQAQLDDARELLAGGGDAPEGRESGARELAALDGGRAGARARDAVARAMEYRGTPYQWGGESPATGFDCSGLAQYVYGEEGIELPRVAADQSEAGRPVERGDLVAGDLVFFADASGYVHHMGISLGGDRFVHAPHTGDVIKVSSLDEPYYDEQFSGGRRVDGSAPPDPPVRARRLADAPAAQRSAVFAAVRERGARPNTLARLAAVAEGEPPERAERAAGGIEAGDRSLAAQADGYPGDDAGQEAIARWMAARAEAAGLPGALPVMAALVESGLANLDGGDRDSLGFFQMRTSIWDRGEYAGYAEDPELQLRWFVDQAVALKEKRIMQGFPGFGRDPAAWGEWIADVERPAFEYRGRYQEQLDAARGLLAPEPAVSART